MSIRFFHCYSRLCVTALLLISLLGLSSFVNGEYIGGKKIGSSAVNGHKYHGSRLIVEVNDAARVKEIADHFGLKISGRFKHLSQHRGSWMGVLETSNTNQGVSVESAAEILNSLPGVRRVYLDYVVHTAIIPNDSRFTDLWGMHNTGQNYGTADADIDAPEAWDLSTGSSSIIAAIIDTGVDYNHSELSANMWRNPGEIAGNNIDDDANGYIDDIYGVDIRNNDSDPMDDQGHGSHVAGTIGAKGNNGSGVAGVNWNVKIMALKTFGYDGSGYTSDAVTAYEYLIDMKQHGQNVKVVNNSWGGGDFLQPLFDAIVLAGQNGILTVCAAGNNSQDNDVTPFYPASYNTVYVISVAATTRKDNMASFSHYGLTSVDLGAPGSDILSCAPGNNYAYKSGTSMAAPHVTGSVAFLYSLFPNESPIQLKNRILQNVDPLTSLSGKCVTGGRLNLYKAATAVPPVDAQFSWTKNGDYTFIFTDQSTSQGGTITGWNWNFGDGASSTEQNPIHTYSTQGWYNVTLTVTGSGGSTDSISKQAWAGPNMPPTADFSYTAGGLVVTFTDESTDANGTIISWEWNFGDGGTSSLQNPVHTYTAAGTYTVTLTVTDNENAVNSTSQQVTVTAGSGQVPTYCASSGSTTLFGYISRVAVGTFSNSSGSATYTNFNNLTVDLNAGGTYSVSLTTTNASSYYGNWRIYIDYNRDGDFTDANEIAYQGYMARQGNGALTGSFTVPSSGIVLGLKTGMRVSCKVYFNSGSYRGPCDSNTGWGEVEDYAVILH